MGWQGIIRAFSRRYDRTVVISRPEQAYLYRDFCDRFIGWSPGSYRTAGYECRDGRPYDGEAHAGFPGCAAFPSPTTGRRRDG